MLDLIPRTARRQVRSVADLNSRNLRLAPMKNFHE
jgi:uncharacterized protein YjeT (DUF2065 family)